MGFIYLQLHLGLLKPLSVTGINDGDYGIECWIIVLQSSSSIIIMWQSKSITVNVIPSIITVSFAVNNYIYIYYNMITRCYPALCTWIAALVTVLKCTRSLLVMDQQRLSGPIRHSDVC